MRQRMLTSVSDNSKILQIGFEKSQEPLCKNIYLLCDLNWKQIWDFLMLLIEINLPTKQVYYFVLLF